VENRGREHAMIVALLNQKGAGKARLALQLAGQWARRGKAGQADRRRSASLPPSIDAGSTLCRFDRLFGVIAVRSTCCIARRLGSGPPIRRRRPASLPTSTAGSLSTSHWRSAGRIEIAAVQCGITVADMLRDLLAREFPDPDGGHP
jgi:hypothetical protein